MGVRRDRITEKEMDRSYLSMSTDGRHYWYGVSQLNPFSLECIEFNGRILGKQSRRCKYELSHRDGRTEYILITIRKSELST